MKLFILLALQIAVEKKSFTDESFCDSLPFIPQFTNAMSSSELMTSLPYMAYVTFANTQMSFYGGGALISSSHVLTCASNVGG